VYGIDIREDIGNIKKYADEVKPDYVFDHMSFRPEYQHLFQFYSDLRRKGVKTIHVLGDAYLERYKGDLSKVFDLALLGKLRHLEKLQRHWKIPVYYCLYSTLYYKSMGKYVDSLAFKDLVFTGNPKIHSDRSKFLKELSSIMDLKIFKTQSKNDMRDMTLDLSYSSKAILGACTGYDVDGYIDVRPFQYLGAGACMIMRKFKNMDDVIPENLYYPFNSYDNPHEVKEIFDSIPMSWEKRLDSYLFMQKYHSSVKRVGDIISVIKGKRNYIPQLLKEI
jgi:hypothetical protein